MENKEKKDIKAGGRARRALRGARLAKKLYRRGYKTGEIAKRLNKSEITISRYFIMTGGIEKLDEAMHYKNRYIMKLPEKDKLKAKI